MFSAVWKSPSTMSSKPAAKSACVLIAQNPQESNERACFLSCATRKSAQTDDGSDYVCWPRPLHLTKVNQTLRGLHGSHLCGTVCGICLQLSRPKLFRLPQMSPACQKTKHPTHVCLRGQRWSKKSGPNHGPSVARQCTSGLHLSSFCALRSALSRNQFQLHVCCLSNFA